MIGVLVSGGLAVGGLAVVVVSAALALNRRRWPFPLLLVTWFFVVVVTWCAWVLLAGLIPVTLYALFELAVLVIPSSPGSFLQYEFQPEAGWAILTSVLGWVWIPAVAVSALVCGRRGSIPARLWILATVLAGPFVAVFPVGLCWVGDIAAYGWAVAAVFGVCELSLIALVVLMHGHPPE